MELSVVIPTQGRPRQLRRTLEHLDNQRLAAGTTVEVLVAIDEQSEAVPQLAASLSGRRFPSRLVRASRPGVSAKRNVGWQSAAGRLVLFLGDDILADRTLLAEHLRSHRVHAAERFGILGHVRWARELRVSSFMRWLEHGAQFDYPSIDRPDVGWGRFYTANLSLKRVMLERTGGFDERYLFGYEDLELGMRLYRVGFTLLYNPRARAEHLHPTDIESWRRRMAQVAVAERQFCTANPSVPPFFYNMMSLAQRRPPSRGRLAALARWVPRSWPVVGERVWYGADWYFPQQLAGAFMAAWNSDRAEGAPAPGPDLEEGSRSRG